MSKKIIISREEFMDLYENKKLTTFQIARRFNCCQATVWKRLNEFNVRPRLPGVKRVDLSRDQIYDLYVNKKLSTWQIEKKLSIPRSTIHRKLREFDIGTRDRAESHLINFREDFSGDLIEKAYLIGFRIGDLGVRKIWPNSKTITVASGSTIKEQIDLIKDLFKNYGTVKISKTKNNKINIWVGLNESFNFLLSKEVPCWINKSKEIFFSFLAGFTDAEGNFGVYNHQAKFQIGNYDKNILIFISQKLNKLGIICRGPYETKMNKYVNNQGYPYNHNYFQVSVNRKDSLLKLFNFLKGHIRHKNKIEDLKKAELNIIMRNNKNDKTKKFPDKHGNRLPFSKVSSWSCL